jgi:AraC family transcriptional regulator
MYNVVIREEPPRQLAALPHAGSYSLIGQSMALLFATVAEQPEIDSRGLLVGLFYDDPSNTPVDRLRSHVGIVVDSGTPIAPPLVGLRMRGGRYAIVHYAGSYAGAENARDFLVGDWLTGSQEIAANAPLAEVYYSTETDIALGRVNKDIMLALA